MDEQGRFVTQLQAFALLVYYLLEVRGQRVAVVRSITTTSMADKLGARYGVPVYETAVGFKYVGPLMMQHDALVGGEESGGYGFRGHVPERDGILAGLYFLDLMVATGRTPSQIISDLYDLVGPYYDRLDIRFDAEARGDPPPSCRGAPEELDDSAVASVDSIDGVHRLVDGSWLLIRFLGRSRSCAFTRRPIARNDASDSSHRDAHSPAFDMGQPRQFDLQPYARRIEKPWGWELHWVPADKPYMGKIIHINAGARLSLQKHDQKLESWLLLKGRAKVVWESVEDGELQETELEIGNGFSCAVNQRHRLVGITDCEIIEVSTPELGTTERLDDDYHRGDETPDERLTRDIASADVSRI
jgi:mannose-6-phosphate isomerase-like protein (cupin superfamily)